jgi:hypothetical protein
MTAETGSLNRPQEGDERDLADEAVPRHRRKLVKLGKQIDRFSG